MKLIRYPKRSEWSALLARPAADLSELEELVHEIVDTIKNGGDAALRKLTKAHDGVEIGSLAVTEDELNDAAERVPDELKAAIRTAKLNIDKFHRSQIDEPCVVETTPGVRCWRRSVAIEKVGFYVPAGSAPLFSTVLMLAVPAQIAGCSEIVLCSPPKHDGSIDDAILFTAKLCGVTRVFKVGGAQAIAAMAFGTESIPKVLKIFGPGNQYVTRAKQIVATEVAIDMPAGPSELAILADSSCIPKFVAADLLSQAEHGPDSQVLLVSSDERVISETRAEVERQLQTLPRCEVATKSLAHSRAVLVETTNEGLDLLNTYAPEHLILAVDNSDELAERVINAGSVFLGNYSCESAGDYASGTNHTLPTAGFARSQSGVSLDSFVKKITFQELTPLGVRNLGPEIEIMAKAEGLVAHMRAISVRLEAINGD